MKTRHLARYLTSVAKTFPAVWLMGPRQSGKTTLARTLFPDYHYISFEDLDLRDFAAKDPRGFIRQYPSRVILDEAQRCPDLLSYLQTHLDKEGLNGQFILTGSQQFVLARSIKQSLAGRVAILHLFPFSLSELWECDPVGIDKNGRPPVQLKSTLETVIFQGLYPAVHDRNVPPTTWYSSYFATYVERDVQEMMGVKDLALFSTFVRLCAARSGTLLNQSELASAVGLSHSTVHAWLGLLERSGLIFLLQPHHANFSKRLVKTPKLYFMDTGLLCYLLRIQSADQIPTHPLKGALFETWVVSEIAKHFWHRGEEPPLYFWRDHKGQEIDLLVDFGSRLWPVEIKSAETIHSDFVKTIRWWEALEGNRNQGGTVIFGGREPQLREGFCYRPWAVSF